MRRPGAERIAEPRRRVVLTRGLTVTGRVVDAGGRPVKGARVQLGDRFGGSVPVGTTDDRGAFTLEHCEARPDDRHGRRRTASRRTIQDVRVEGQPEPLVVTLSEPGCDPPRQGRRRRGQAGRRRHRRRRHLARAAVAPVPGHDRRGRPVRMAQRAPGRRALRRLQARLHGEPTRPADRIGSRARHHALPRAGHHRRRDRRRDRPAAAEVPPDPGPEVPVARGRPTGLRTRRWRSRAADTRPGSTSRPTPSSSGSRPRATSRPSRAPSGRPRGARRSTSPSGAARGLSGVVLLPDGQPAAGAEVVLATERMGFLDAGGTIRSQGEPPEGHGPAPMAGSRSRRRR